MLSQLRLLLLWLCAVASAFVSKPAIAQTSCGLRMRRSWSSLSDGDQTLYKNALATSMDSGAYAKFVEIHTEMMSAAEAHKQCMFIYWHRLFLVVFENMLRGMGSAYACITVPYWDWISDYNRLVNRQCTTMLNCSSALQALGGVTGTQMLLKVNGVQTSGNCSTSYPLDHFCHATDVKGSQCIRCVTRGAWGTNRLPGSASYASVRNQLFSAKDIAEMSTAIENGVHNNIHATLNGSMATFASPADPIFWSHHAMVDLLHTIFHRCRVGEQQMTMEQKVTSPIGWNSCKRQNGAAFSPYDSVVMRTGVYGRKPISGAKDPLIRRYFDGVPNQFAALMDHKDLGSSSYVYLYQGLLGEMYYKCGNSTADPTKVPVTTTPSPVTTPPIQVSTPAPTTKIPVTMVPPTASPTTTPTLTAKDPTIMAQPTPSPAPKPSSTTKAPVTTTPPAPMTAAPVAPVTPVIPLTPVPNSSATNSVLLPSEAPASIIASPLPAPVSTTSTPLQMPASVMSASRDAAAGLSNAAPLSLPTPPTAEDLVAAEPAPIPINAPKPGEPDSTADLVAVASSADALPPPTASTVAAPPASLPDTTESPTVVIIAAVNTTLDAAAQKVSTFAKHTDAFIEAQLGADVDQIEEQEKMACMFQDECLGGVMDYSEEFKRTFRTCGKPRCKQIVDDIRSGNDSVGLPNWKEKMMKTFGCPVPTALQPLVS